MELRHLRYFVAVAQALNFTRAAEKLHTSQPSLSSQIRDLENCVGVPLLVRDKRKVALTAAGECFLQDALAILEQAENAKLIGASEPEYAGSVLTKFTPLSCAAVISFSCAKG